MIELKSFEAEQNCRKSALKSQALI